MPNRETPAPGSPREWLARARSSLNLAGTTDRTTDVLLEDLCFQAQQAAEKAVKAVLLAKGIPFRYVHDIDELFSNAEEGGVDVPGAIRRAVVLTGYASQTRYPGDYEPVTDDEYEDAVALAAAVVAWAERVITE